MRGRKSVGSASCAPNHLPLKIGVRYRLRRRIDAAEEALHGRVAPGEAVLLNEELADGMALHTLLAPG
jgi:hypothetical protein